MSCIEKLSKLVCSQRQIPKDEMDGNQDANEYFTALVCGEPLPEEEFSDDRRDGGDGEGPSKETMCYFFNYEHFAHHVAGPDDGDVPPITPANFKFDDDIDDGVDMCVLKVEGEEVDRIPCDCSNPREFMKNIPNKGMFFYVKKSPK